MNAGTKAVLRTVGFGVAVGLVVSVIIRLCIGCAAIEKADPVVPLVMMDCHNGHSCPETQVCVYVQLANGSWCGTQDANDIIPPNSMRLKLRDASRD